MKVLQGNALDLSVYEDNTFDLTLVLGPMYHLYTDEDKQQALKEAVRVTKPAGYIMVAYCMNESVIVQEFFMRGNVKKYLENNMVTENFHCLSKPEDLFAMVRIEEIHRFTEALPVKRQKTVATDGASHYLKPLLAEMEDDIFACWLRYHFATCERPDLIGATNHSLDILQKLPE